MELNIETPKPNGKSNGHLPVTQESRSARADSLHKGHISIFDPNKYMLKLPKTKKVTLPNGQVRFEKTEADYLPVAARIAWFRKDHPYWSIITEVEQLENKAVVMKATIKDMLGNIIATARKKETEIGFLDYIEKAETGAIGRALAMCGYAPFKRPSLTSRIGSQTHHSRKRRIQTKFCKWSCSNTRPQRRTYERDKEISNYGRNDYDKRFRLVKCKMQDLREGNYKSTTSVQYQSLR